MRKPLPRRADMVVVGGGPAGAVTAWLAARDGLQVLLVDPLRTGGRIEGLSPRLHRWLVSSGIGTGDSVVGPLPRRVDWAGIADSANGEYLVRRDRLDAHLRDAAVASGATLIEGTARPEGQTVDLGDGQRIEAGWVIDARGRGAHGRDATRRPGFSTIAISGACRGAQPAEPGISVTALAGGWVWTAALPGGELWAQYSCDARGDAPPEARLAAALAEARPEPGEIRFDAPPRAREAAPVLPAPIASLTALPVGDAFAAMDPLSGHGLFWAVSSALAAAAVRRTLAARPGAASEALCRRYIEERARETCLRNARIGRDFLRQETRFADAPFWRARRDFPDDLPSHAPRDEVSVAQGLVLRDGLIEEMEILKTPRSPDGIGWLGRAPATQVWRDFQSSGPGEAFLGRWGPAAQALLAEMSPR
ncbi:NAD(P)-binding protein [Salipiger sp. HF18]|nr:NAD(P)-binding protein [Salipiger sp. HF18]